MATPHVELPAELELPAEYRHVQEYLDLMDPDLRLRRSAEGSGFYVLERRCRRAPAVNTGYLTLSDIHVQARDGYIHVSTVHPNWLEKPWNIMRALAEEGADLWAIGGAKVFTDEQEYEARFLAETKRRRRLGIFRDIARDAYGPLSALGNADGTERTQIGMRSASFRNRFRRLTTNPSPKARRSLSFFLNGGNFARAGQAKG